MLSKPESLDILESVLMPFCETVFLQADLELIFFVEVELAVLGACDREVDLFLGVLFFNILWESFRNPLFSYNAERSV